MRRIKFGGIVFVVAVVAVVLPGCGPTPGYVPPGGVPPDYVPPVIESLQVSPQPARPGDTLTVIIEASDAATDLEEVTGSATSLITPDNITLNAWDVCTSETIPQGDVKHVLITITCPVPEYATTGTWHVRITISDGFWRFESGVRKSIPFEVVDGTDDHIPPQLVHYATEPATVYQETTFTLTMRLRDEALPVQVGDGGNGWNQFGFYKLFAQHSHLDCMFPSFTPVSSTEVDVVITCTPYNFHIPGRAEGGLHRAFMRTRDALGHEGNIEMFIDVQPA